MKPNIKLLLSQFCCLLFMGIFLATHNVTAQERFEPEVLPIDPPITYSDVDYRNGLGFSIQLHNFGAGIGGQYRRVLGPLTEGLFEFHLTSLRDASEQSFTNYWGQQIISNKYNRILNAPMMAGVKHRLFPEALSDNFRVYIQGVAGPTVAFVYPYFTDTGLGYRQQNQPPNDIFQGWGDGHFTWGTAGHLSLGVDFGDSFSRIQSINFGYYFHYFADGIQVMEPNSPIPGNDGFDPIKFFGSAKVSFVFGGMW